MFVVRRKATSLLVALFLAAAFYHYRIVTLPYLPSFDQHFPISSTQWYSPGHGVQDPPSGQQNPLASLIPLPTGTLVQIPKIQHAFGKESKAEKSKRLSRRNAVKAAFARSWKGYKKHAWLHDEVTPVEPGALDTFGGWAATLVDSLDTLWLMGMKEEFEIAVAALDKIDFSRTEDAQLNVFETTIRYLGGFVGAYDISDGAYPMLLKKAVEVGDFLYGAFDTPNRMPIARWGWRGYQKEEKQEADPHTLIAELGSLSLEFTRLSQITGDFKYFDAVQRISDVLEEAQSATHIPGLWPVVANAKDMTFKDTGFTLGGMADSTYEYLPKQHLLLGGLSSQSQKMYELAIEQAKKHIFFRPMIPTNESILVSGGTSASTSTGSVKLDHKGQHLSCFTGGMVGIGAKIFNRKEELDIAQKLVDGCIWAYDATSPTGIMPEVFELLPCPGGDDECTWDQIYYEDELLKRYHHFVATSEEEESDSPPSRSSQISKILTSTRLSPGFLAYDDKRYMLRPEAIESVFILYRITGSSHYADAAWRMFERIEKYTKTETANAAIKDVSEEEPEKDNRMESFWMAETLKYFYAIFSEPDVLDLDRFVLNTEAHGFLRPGVV